MPNCGPCTKGVSRESARAWPIASSTVPKPRQELRDLYQYIAEAAFR
jgi:hypothetical protein